MKKCIPCLMAFMILFKFSNSFAQNLTVEGKAQILEIEKVNNAENAVVLLSNGYLAETDALLKRLKLLEQQLNSFETCGPSSVVDIDGNCYNVILIGNQYWMKENLKTHHFNDGTLITEITDDLEWQNATSPAYCKYQNLNVFENIYGSLYNHFAVSSNKNICPLGWHVPSNADWTELIDFLDPGMIYPDSSIPSLVAGGKMKETGIAHWKYPNNGATNDSGFTGLPAGFRDFDGEFQNIKILSAWWSATEVDEIDAYYYGLGWSHAYVLRFDTEKPHGLSVRCLKD